MRNLAIAWLVASAGFAAALPAVHQPAAAEVDALFGAFWSAGTPREAAPAAAAIVKSGIPFAEAWLRLKRGREYASTVPRGLLRLSRQAQGIEYFYNVEVPESYDPARRYQVRFQLHGGVMGRETGAPRGAGTIGALAGAPDQIYVIPFAWRDVPWWSVLHEENLGAILDSLKRSYNVDENRVALAGVSDGGTAAYYFAMRTPTPFSSFLALNGHIMVLGGGRLGVGELYPNNLLNRPLFVVNGALDQVYPAAGVGPFVQHLQRRGVPIEYTVRPDGAHNTEWWPAVREPFEAFVRDHPRNPYPDRVTWETDRTDTHHRAAWLVLDEMRTPTEPPLPDVNEFSRDLSLHFGVVGYGTRVSLIQPGSTAQRLGLRPGDTIESINGRPMPDATELEAALRAFHPGERVVLIVTRGDERMELHGTTAREDGPGPVMFIPSRSSGRVDLVKAGNTVQAHTRGIAAFTLLLSPDAFDFSQPVRVTVNGRVAFDGRVERSLETLMKWAARDNDRTMLFGAELKLEVGM
jgi:hypothetical protein